MRAPARSADPWNTQSAVEIFDDPFVEPVMLVPDLDLGPGRPCGLWSAPGAGKNVTAQAIGVAVATGRPVFGRFASSRGRVLHITYDYGAQATKLRYRQLANGMGVEAGELAGQLDLAPFPSVNLASPDAVEAFTRKFEGFQLVILDNLRSATGSADENASTFGSFVEVLGTASEKTGATALYLHHTKKSDDGTVDTNSGRGSGAILGASGSIWGIEKHKDDRKLVHIRAHDMAEQMFDPVWLTLTPSEQGTFDTGKRTRALSLTAHDENPTSVADRSQKEARQEALVMKAIGANPGIGAAALREKAAPLPDKDADAAVARLLKRGEVVDRGTGRDRAPRAYHLASATSVGSDETE